MFSAIWHRIQRIHMREKVFALFVVGTLGAMLLQSILLNWYSSQIICRQTREMGQTALQNLQDDLYQELKSIENSMISIYDNHALIHKLGKSGVEEDNSAAYTLAVNAFAPEQNVVALYIYTQSHELISSYRHAQTPKYTYPKDIYDSDFENNAERVQAYVESQARNTFISSYYNPYREKTLMRFVIRLYESAGQPVGYLVCDIDSKAMQQLMEKYHYVSASVIWLQAQGDQVLLQVGTGGSGEYALLRQLQQTVAEGGDISGQGLDGYELIAVTQKKYALTAYSLIPWSAFFADQRTLNQITIFVFAVVLGLFTVLFVMLSNSLTKPLRHMMQVMRRVESGETELRLHMTRADEIGELGDTFDNMMDQIQILNARKYQDQMRLNDAKYKALQAQVNPHFLYNTLDTMAGIAVSYDCFRVSALCRALSGIFRYSLDMKDPFATLEQELFHLKNYLFVINERMKNAIQMRVEVDTALLGARLPRLSLQPLVENAVQHGLKDKRGEKNILIRAEVCGETLCITVADNGVGMDVDAVNEKLSSPRQEVLNRGSSIGMENINARIRILFGGQYGLRAERVPEGGGCIRMELPYLIEEKETQTE